MKLRILVLAMGCLLLSVPTMVTAKPDKEVVVPLDNPLSYDCTSIDLTSYEMLVVDYAIDVVVVMDYKSVEVCVTGADDLLTDVDDVGWLTNKSLYTIKTLNEAKDYNVPNLIPLNKNLSNTLYKNVNRSDYGLPLLVPLN